MEWLRLGSGYTELFDVAVIPAARCPIAIAPDRSEMLDAVTFEEDVVPLAEFADTRAVQEHVNEIAEAANPARTGRS